MKGLGTPQEPILSGTYLGAGYVRSSFMGVPGAASTLPFFPASGTISSIYGKTITAGTLRSLRAEMKIPFPQMKFIEVWLWSQECPNSKCWTLRRLCLSLKKKKVLQYKQEKGQKKTRGINPDTQAPGAEGKDLFPFFEERSDPGWNFYFFLSTTNDHSWNLSLKHLMIFGGVWGRLWNPPKWNQAYDSLYWGHVPCPAGWLLRSGDPIFLPYEGPIPNDWNILSLSICCFSSFGFHHFGVGVPFYGPVSLLCAALASPACP